MNTIITAAALDLVAILTLCGMYVTRHRRRDLVVSYIIINVGVFAVTVALANADATSAGMGMGLFGVLSIIRLRSTELDQREVAYYFAALALGLLMGIGLEPIGLAIGLSALLLAIMFVVDHSKLMTTLRSQTIIVDRAISDEEELKTYLSTQLGYTIENATIAELDLINDKTIANIRYTVGDSKKIVPTNASSLTSLR
ncbi:DUF4956 domain-containing protein [Rothia nasimurium]|uniref:DUF4956 domain-containing protein n=1 Tax=Rothia nasimurium TaxID=85336 RepID=UPI001F22079D|nr:DUF4956 domain-containing protein [Rothia nasimurium]